MLAGDKNLLKATLAKGVLEIQLALIQLYTDNLNSIGTEAAILAGFAFTGIGSTPFPQVGLLENVLEFFYFCCISASFGTALFCLCQATIVTTYGPAMALSGDSATSVKYAAGHMKLQQDFVFVIGFMCITCFFTAAVALSWARRPTGQAILCSLIYLGALALIIVKGFQVYKSVNAHGDIDAEDYENLKKGRANQSGESYKSVKASESSEVGSALHNHHSSRSSVVDRESVLDRNTLVDGSPPTPQRAMGQLWFRDSIDLGGQLHERFAVIDKGVLEIYRNERDFENGKDAINEMPFQLKKYALELETKKFKRGLTSGRKSFRRLVSGQGEISLPVYVSSEFDLKTAVKRFQFIIYPKVLSEVNPLPVGEFMANDELSYKQWVETIQSAMNMHSSQPLAHGNVVNRAMSAHADIELVEHAVARSNIV